MTASTTIPRSILAAFLAMLLVGPAARGMGFCVQRTSVSKEACEAQVVVIGTLSKPRLAPGTTDQGVTELRIDRVLKGAAALDGERVFLMPRYVASARDKPLPFLIFGDSTNGVIDWYRGLPCDGAADTMVDYFEGAFSAWRAPSAQRLAYFARFLCDPDPEIATDAYLILSEAARPDLREAVRFCDHDALLNGLIDPRTPAYCRSLIAMLVGMCGQPEDASFLRAALESLDIGLNRAGFLYGFCLVDSKIGLSFICDELLNTKLDFNRRYSALRALNDLLEDEPGLDRERVFATLVTGLDQSDIADLYMEALRKNGHWKSAGAVLAPRPADDPPITRRAQLRFALACPTPEARAFVAKVRKDDPEFVADAEELLNLERNTARKANREQKWWLAWLNVLAE